MRNKYAAVSDPNTFITEPGDKFHIKYDPKINADGTIDLVEVGKEDIQAIIDSYLPTTDLAYIVKRLKMGDNSVLNQKTPMYGDFTEMPKTYAESLQMVIDAERKFYDLPIDVRNAFNNDYMQWLAQTGTENWFSKMGYDLNDYNKTDNDQNVKEVIDNES